MPKPSASLRHGTGGIATSRGGVQRCSHAPRISGTDALRWFPVAPDTSAPRIHRPERTPKRPLRAGLARPYPRHCERSRAHPRTREAAGPRAQARAGRGSRRPAPRVRLERRQPRVRRRDRALAGRGHHAHRRGPPERPVDDRLHARRRRRRSTAASPSGSRRRSATSRMSACTPTQTAHDLNHSVAARAFATGTDVYFAQDQYKPDTSDGDQPDRPRARARRPAARRADERPADRLQPGRRDGERGGRRGRRDSHCTARAADLLRLHRPPRDGGGRARRGLGPRPRRPVPRPLHLRRGRAAAHAGRLGVSDADERLQHVVAGARARPARGRGARGLRGDRAQPALRAPVRVPAGRRHAQAAEPAAGRAAARGRGALARRRDGRLRRRRPAAPPRRAEAARRRADAARRAPDQGRRPARRGPARRAHGRVRRSRRGCGWSSSPRTTRAATRRWRP